MDWKIIAILGIGSIVIGLILYIPAHFLAKYLLRRTATTSIQRSRITALGVLVYGILVCALVAGFAQGHLSPHTWFGQVMSNVGGQFLYGLVLTAVLGIVENLLKARGHALWVSSTNE